MASTLKNKWNRIVIILFLAIFSTAQWAHAQCIASGPNNPGTTASPVMAGAYTFSSPGNVVSSNNQFASASTLVSLLNGHTNNLQAINYGFSIPLAASICGIQVDVEKKATNIGINLFLVESYVTDRNVQLLKNGALVGSNYSNAAHWTTTDTYYTYGGASDTWGTAWTAADINNSNFGISFSADITDLLGLIPNALVDHMRITVYYMDPVVLPLRLTQFNVSAGAGQTALLQWKTPTQDESMDFAVERSSNGRYWENVAGAPQYNYITGAWSFTDARPIPGDSYYRLRMINASGTVLYSASKSLFINNNMRVKCYPNPFTSYIQLTGLEPGAMIMLTNEYGQVIRSVRYNNSSNKLDLHSLKPGVYFVCSGNSRLKIIKR